jgi:hypothetical protein
MNCIASGTLLTGGIVTGPIYILVLVGLVEILTRLGFDPTRHDLGLMMACRLKECSRTTVLLYETEEPTRSPRDR